MNDPHDPTYKGSRPHGTKIARFQQFLYEMEEDLAWSHGAVYRGHTIRKQKGGYLLILRVQLKGKPLVGFYGGESIVDCWRKVYDDLHRKETFWRPDRYA